MVQDTKLIQNGQVPPATSAAVTKGIPGGHLEALARESSDKGQHFVSCSLWAAAALAYGGSNGQQVRQDMYLAHVEQKLGMGQSLSLVEKMTKSTDRVAAAAQPKSAPSRDEISTLFGSPQTGAPPAQASAPSGYVASPPPSQPATPVAPQPAVPLVAQTAAPMPVQTTVPQHPAVTKYTPLPNGDVADSGIGRMQWVQQHPTRSGTPAACNVDWTGSGPLSQQCAAALFAQAEAERAAADCVAALTDYDNAKQAAQNAGQITMMTLKQADGRKACGDKNPPKPNPGVTWGKPGLMPIGRYTCYSAPAVIANGGASGATIVQVGQWQGYVWIFDDHRYAAPYHEDDTGTYRMNGTTMVALDGPYGPKRNNTTLSFLQKGVYGRPTIHVSFLDGNGSPLAGTACTHDGPPEK